MVALGAGAGVLAFGALVFGAGMLVFGAFAFGAVTLVAGVAVLTGTGVDGAVLFAGLLFAGALFAVSLQAIPNVPITRTAESKITFFILLKTPNLSQRINPVARVRLIRHSRFAMNSFLF